MRGSFNANMNNKKVGDQGFCCGYFGNDCRVVRLLGTLEGLTVVSLLSPLGNKKARGGIDYRLKAEWDVVTGVVEGLECGINPAAVRRVPKVV